MAEMEQVPETRDLEPRTWEGKVAETWRNSMIVSVTTDLS